MKPQEKAIELIDKYKQFVHGYIGSSMLTNYEYPEQILSQAKKCSLITVDQLLELNVFWISPEMLKANPDIHKVEDTFEFWEEVKKIIEFTKV